MQFDRFIYSYYCRMLSFRCRNTI